MKVFISWSGDSSKQLGEVLRDWIPNVLQSVTPYFTPSDIEKGTKWSTDIGKELEESQVGLLCVTRDNAHSDWILFEAGALSKSIDKSNVCPILFGITPPDLSGPLQQFQATSFNKSDFHKLLGTINNKSDHKLPQKNFEAVFDMWWPDAEAKIKQILEQGRKDDSPMRSDRELLEEILMRTRSATRVVDTTNPVSIAAIISLLENYIVLHDTQASGEGGYQETLDQLKKMHKSITHIASRFGRRDRNIEQLLSKLESLDYVVEENEEDKNKDTLPF